MNPAAPDFRLSGSTSNDNVYLKYVCLVNGHQIPEDGTGRRSLHLVNNVEEQDYEEEGSFQIERTTALHELLQGHKPTEDGNDVLNHNNATTATSQQTTTSEDRLPSEPLEIDQRCLDNPHVLKLTKMKWLSEGQGGSPDSSPSISPAISSTSSMYSCESEDGTTGRRNITEKYLSTILRMDKEHNLFGLSNMTSSLIGSKMSTFKKKRKEDENPVFHQTAIVQVCSGCPSRNCRHQSKSALPSSLMCGSCRSCSVSCYDASCLSCSNSCSPPRPPTNIFKPTCQTCPRVCKSRSSKKCIEDCETCFGLKIKLNRKPKFDPPACELTPRASCIMDKPMAARACTHCPKCVPPTAAFPFLMPCYWPSRPSAPCPTPDRCFHNPPCMPARKRKQPVDPGLVCPKSCSGMGKKVCPNPLCPGLNEAFKKEFETKYSNKVITKESKDKQKSEPSTQPGAAKSPSKDKK